MRSGAGPGRRRASTSGPAPGSEAAWRRQARAFESEDLQKSYIGPEWRKRIVYEILRTPSLVRDSGRVAPPRTPRALSRGQLAVLREGTNWAPTTLALHFAALRRFARWAHNPLADEPGAWAVSQAAPTHRRWLTRAELAELYCAAGETEKVLISLEGFNGLRRVEVLRLRVKDVDTTTHRLHVLGKGKNGGKWRTIPLFPETELRLSGHIQGRAAEARVVPLSRSGADLLLRRAADRSGLPARGVPVSHHDLRRTFGRLSYQAGMDLVQLKNLYGHSSLDQTVHYIGLDEDRMRAGLDSLARSLRPLLRRASTPVPVKGYRSGPPPDSGNCP
jgi:integrase